MEHREQISSALRAVGYTYVALDLVGFKSGSLNAAVDPLKTDP
jgi:PP-loop superfamily ATP-utilizing enzyme